MLAVVTGCVATADLYKGNPVTKVSLVALETGGPTAGRWETFDMAIDYNYTLNQGLLDISGKVIPSSFYRLNYASFRQITVYAFALNKDNRVAQTTMLVSLGGVGTDQNFDFSHRFQVPAGTTGLSFGYNGEAKEAASSHYFQELPINK